jgi:hypothetical protein
LFTFFPGPVRANSEIIRHRNKTETQPGLPPL